jgi:hypothetical protein
MGAVDRARGLCPHRPAPRRAAGGLAERTGISRVGDNARSVQRRFFAALYGLTQFPETRGGDVAKRAPEQPSRKNGGFGDGADVRCKCAHVRFGEQFNKRSFLGGLCKRSQCLLRPNFCHTGKL